MLFYCSETTRPSTSRAVPETITLRDSPTRDDYDDDDIAIIPCTSSATPLKETTNNDTAAFSRWSRRPVGPVRPWHQTSNDIRILSSTVCASHVLHVKTSHTLQSSPRPKVIDMEEHERYRMLLRLASRTPLCKLSAEKEQEASREQTPTAPKVDIDTTISEWNETKERIRKSADTVELLREKLFVCSCFYFLVIICCTL